MRSLYAIVVLSSFLFVMPAEPEPDFPMWASPKCLLTISRIVQHEVGSMDYEAWRFVAEQAVYDARRMGCETLTKWRWKIGEHYANRVDPRIRRVVLDVALDYPRMSHARCQFVGNLADVGVWRAAGYPVSVDYRHDFGRFTLVGVNCR